MSKIRYQNSRGECVYWKYSKINCEFISSHKKLAYIWEPTIWQIFRKALSRYNWGSSWLQVAEAQAEFYITLKTYRETEFVLHKSNNKSSNSPIIHLFRMKFLFFQTKLLPHIPIHLFLFKILLRIHVKHGMHTFCF